MRDPVASILGDVVEYTRSAHSLAERAALAHAAGRDVAGHADDIRRNLNRARGFLNELKPKSEEPEQSE
ncbi:MAG: hypothetical protein MJA83_03085 [Gammaproteobacteria bacterium]|nr:hypothetical protein [Gammaproteobacteria bacterium]